MVPSLSGKVEYGWLDIASLQLYIMKVHKIWEP